MEDHRNTISLKDVALFLPLLGTSLALSWEVGVFIPYGRQAFGLFTLGEHLTFALSGLPVALIGASFIVVIILISATLKAPVVERSTRYFINQKRPTRNFIWTFRAVLCAIAIVGLGMLFYGVWHRSPMAIVLGLYQLGYTLGLAIDPLTFKKNVMLTSLGIVCFGLLFAFAAGIETSLQTLRQAQNASLISIGNDQIKMTVLFTGEKGILAYNAREKKFNFLRSADVKQITWKRSVFVETKNAQ